MQLVGKPEVAVKLLSGETETVQLSTVERDCLDFPQLPLMRLRFFDDPGEDRASTQSLEQWAL